MVVFVDVGFNYDVNDGVFFFVELFSDYGSDFGLVFVVFLGVVCVDWVSEYSLWDRLIFEMYCVSS